MTTEATQTDTPQGQQAPESVSTLPPDLIDNTIKQVLQSNREKLAARYGVELTDKAKAEPADTATAPEQTAAEPSAAEPEEESAAQTEEEQKQDKVQPKTKSLEEEAKSRREAERKMHEATQKAKEEARRAAELEKRLKELEERIEAERSVKAELERRLQEYQEKQAKLKEQEVAQAIKEVLRRMQMADPDEDPEKYLETVSAELYEAVKMATLPLAEQIAAEKARLEREALEAKLKAEQEMLRQEEERRRVHDWITGQAKKAGLDMDPNSWDAKQFWRIFNHDIPGDLTISEGVALTIKMVQEEKEQLLKQGVKVAQEAGKKQIDQTPLGRGADRPVTSAPETKVDLDLNKIVDEYLHRRRARP